MKLKFSKQIVKDIRAETPAIREKLALLLDELQKGAILPYPTSRNMSGAPGLRELRLRDEKGIVRVFYIIVKRDAIYVLHLFRKKSQKTPPQEIKLALKRFNKMRS